MLAVVLVHSPFTELSSELGFATGGHQSWYAPVGHERCRRGALARAKRTYMAWEDYLRCDKVVFILHDPHDFAHRLLLIQRAQELFVPVPFMLRHLPHVAFDAMSEC